MGLSGRFCVLAPLGLPGGLGYETNMNAAWWLLSALAVLAIAYRYYSAFLAAKVLCLDDARVTPAHQLEDGHNFHPTNK